ncbi:uncharacterized protein LOC103510511 [Diaphorina citri]|uniref:Uncharacterized protein LOC103510511 n=1 Tax=Diaphorina citri TaxID=121845 RepID=A0A1S3D376_DIACI|nr:uncharacterized protein LOC103510511 [Diaphorina citri]
MNRVAEIDLFECLSSRLLKITAGSLPIEEVVYLVPQPPQQVPRLGLEGAYLGLPVFSAHPLRDRPLFLAQSLRRERLQGGQHLARLLSLFLEQTPMPHLQRRPSQTAQAQTPQGRPPQTPSPEAAQRLHHS